MDEKDRQEQLKDISYKLKSSSNKLKQSLPDDRQTALEFNSLARAYIHTDEILDDIEEQFQKATNLNGIDVTFLFFAVALQCVRQYLITPFKLKDERDNDKDAADKVKGNKKEHSNRKHRLYNPSITEIQTNPVPFDTMFGSKVLGANIGGRHRYKTLGHDPVLGWVFGTANIATSTVTNNRFESFHVKTGLTGRNTFLDMLKQRADTKKVLSYTRDKLLYEEKEGRMKIACSLLKEAEHLLSDVKSKDSLPIPIVSVFSEKMAETLADYGVDTENLLNVGKQAGYALLINFIISTLHRLCYREEKDGDIKLYKVRTRKIVSLSDLIASTSNVIAVAVTEAAAAITKNERLAKKGMKYIDIGGYIVTINRLISDYKLIKKIKMEFIGDGFNSAIKATAEQYEKELRNEC